MKIDAIRPERIMKDAEAAYTKDLLFYEQNRKRFIERECPGCGIASSESFASHRGFNFNRCSACWSVFMSPGPSEELLSEFYAQSNVYRFWSEKVYPSTISARKEKLAIPRSELIINSISDQEDRLKVVEIGSGTGDVLREIKRKLPKVMTIAVEPNPDMWPSYENSAEELIKGGYEVALDLLREVDVICAFEVLEHLSQPEKFLKMSQISLKKGGKLICSTPNAASLEVQQLRGDSNTLDIEHISVLTPLAVHQLASHNGFKVDFIITSYT
jgi:2-polyprenyl-3-methyl-5-hydroxy-6-metoxy-1,4-benzoquinol methylase